MRLSVRTQVLIWLCGLTAVAYLQRNLGAVESALREQSGLNKDQMGLIQASFFWSYALFQVPTAWICKQLGPRAGLSIFCLMYSLAAGLTGLTNDLAMLCFVRFLMGVGQAAALPCLAEVIAVWFPPTYRGRATAWVTAFMQVGALLNAFASAPLVSKFTMSGYFWILAVPGIVWSFAFYAWYRNDPREFSSLTQQQQAELPEQQEQSPDTGSFRWLRMVLRVIFSSVLWMICLQQFFRAAGYIFFGTWFTTYMREARGYDLATSGAATGCAYCGVLFGSLAGGMISDWILERTGNDRLARQGVAVTSLILCAACIGGFYFIRGEDPMINIIAVSVMTLGAFFSGVAGPSGYTVTIDVAGKYVGPVFGCMNMAGNLGAAIFAQVVPRLLGPSKNQWGTVFVVFATLYLMSAAFWLLIDSRKTIFGRRNVD